jgi:septal ring factor EnvC (AmiA/AmiB activator)
MRPANVGGDFEMIEFVDKVKPFIEMIAWVGTLITVITLLIVNRTKIKNWQDNRRERSRKLDDLISNATELQETHKMLAELIEAATRTTESVTTLAKTVEETIAHNKRQDAELERSRNQRRVHDIALFALVDTAAQNGHDGAITEARKVMLEHLQEVAHEPVYKGEC